MMVLDLIQNGDLEKLREIALKEGNEKVKLNSDQEEIASIHLAASLGKLAIVQFLVESPVQEDPGLCRMNNFSPLHAAAMNGHKAVVEYLIHKGANINVQTDPQKYAPLHSASFGGHIKTVEILVKNGARTDLKNYRNEYPIDTAKRQNQQEVVNFLKEVNQ